MRIVRKILKGLGLLFVVLLVAGAVYQQWGLFQDAKEHPAPGRMVDVGGLKLHLLCTGPEIDLPTVLLDGGSAFISTAWQWVIDDLSQDMRVCAFDRAGFGWSEEGQHPLDGHQKVKELHALLEAAEIDRPIVYVGHSLGGMLGRIHYDFYPEDLVGLVMIEPGNAEIMLSEIGEDRGGPVERTEGIRPCGYRCTLATIATHLGITRLAIALMKVDLLDDPKWPQDAIADFKARSCHASNMRHVMAVGRYLTRTFHQTTDNRDLGDLPVMVIYSTGFGSLLGSFESEEEQAADLEFNKAAWRETAELSTNSLGLREIEGGNHLAIIGYEENATQVADYVREIVYLEE